MLTCNNKDNRVALKHQVLNKNNLQINKNKIKKKTNKIKHLFSVKDYNKIKLQFLVNNKVRTNNKLKLIIIKSI